MKKILLLTCLTLLVLSCGIQKEKPSNGNIVDQISSLKFIDETIIPSDFTFKNTKVGGLSGIDFNNNNWYLICDDRAAPRFYTVDLSFTTQGFRSQEVTSVTYLKDKDGNRFTSGVADPESLRVTASNDIIWTSEGNISKRIDPFIRVSSADGTFKEDIKIPKRYLAEQDGIKGPRNNGVFESLSQNYNSSDFWTVTELPLEEDGDVPTSKGANSPVRIAFIDASSKTFGREYAYQLDKVARQGELEINGVTEILSYDKSTFLVLERSYAKGHSDGGNNVKIYKVDTRSATDVSKIPSLYKADYKPVQKELLLDFETVRDKLTDGIVDNIEGMTFGPNFPNGNRSLILVSDNNFNSFGKQLTQFILFEIQ